MNVIENSKKWDKMLNSIEVGIVADTVAKLLNRPVRTLEHALGLGAMTRTSLFGTKAIPYKSIILDYVDSLAKKAREEIDSCAEAGEPSNRAHFGIDRKKRTHIEDAKLIRSAVNDLMGNEKVLPADRITAKERIERHIRFENPDRVAIAPLLGFHTARAGGITVREYMTDGFAAAAASRRTWDLYGGFDIIPFNFPMGYIFPLVPESHSRFCCKWFLPDDDELPKMDEVPRPFDYGTIEKDGLTAFLRTESGGLFDEFFEMAGQGIAYAVYNSMLFPRADNYAKYAFGVINHPADLLSMWLGFERFMIDCAKDPKKVRDACERLGPGLVELGELPARIVGEKCVLYGVSRVSPSWISRKMFDELFAGTFLDQVRTAWEDGFYLTYHLDNDYTSLLDFFLELPKQSGFLHLDQTDLFKAKEKLHGHLCLMGNLHPGLLAAGTAGEVTEQCERLIKEVGAGGGFILASACEVPINTPVENLKAAKESVDRWGWY